mmetsp:Transcript_54708/g.168499  ORF Transcript_54708/g.168499 Transcript_54708/m.168499 type:complete len:248 (-) Transcript_54708:446-1189(-)
MSSPAETARMWYSTSSAYAGKMTSSNAPSFSHPCLFSPNDEKCTKRAPTCFSRLSFMYLLNLARYPDNAHRSPLVAMTKLGVGVMLNPRRMMMFQLSLQPPPMGRYWNVKRPGNCFCSASKYSRCSSASRFCTTTTWPTPVSSALSWLRTNWQSTLPTHAVPYTGTLVTASRSCVYMLNTRARFAASGGAPSPTGWISLSVWKNFRSSGWWMSSGILLPSGLLASRSGVAPAPSSPLSWEAALPWAE